MEWGDVAIAVGPSVVAVVAIGAAFGQQRRTLTHERELADLAAVRSVLDDAALALERIGDLPTVVELFSDAEARWDRWQESGSRDLAPVKARLTVRFGRSHALVMTFDYAMEAVDDWATQSLYYSVSDGEGGPKGEERAKVEQAVADISRQFREHVDQFLDRASVAAGARLP